MVNHQTMRNLFWILITFILAPFLYIEIFLKRLSKKGELRILIIDTGKIGDLTCSTPVFRTIKKKFPKSYLGVAIRDQSYGVIQNNPYIDKVIFLNSEKCRKIIGGMRPVKEIRKEKFNWAINLSPYAHTTILAFWAGIPKRITSTSKITGRIPRLFSFFNDYRLEYKQHTLKLRHNLELLKFLDINNFSEKKEVFITEQENKKAKEFLRKNNLKETNFLIGITVTAGNKIKEWEPIKFSQLADRLVKELKAKIIFIGPLDDKIIIDKVRADMKNKAIRSIDFKVNELPALLKKLKLFISVDIGPLYIAHTVGTPVVDILGPCSPNDQPPTDRISEIVQKDIYCVPCSFVFPGARHCKEGHFRCIKEITVDDVFKAVKKLTKKIYNI